MSELLERLSRLLHWSTLSLTTFDGHCVRIDFPNREEAEQMLDVLVEVEALRKGTSNV